jgi:hypothetical protein
MTRRTKMTSVLNENAVPSRRQNVWGSPALSHHRGAVAVGACRAYVQSEPDASNDALWVKAQAVASEVFDVPLDTGDPASDSSLLGAIDATIALMLFAYMQELREHARYREFWLGTR